MFITHSYLGTTHDPYRCLFFLLLEDYIELQTRFMRDMEPYLERFARRLGHEGALIRPFAGDIEDTRQHVLDKAWSPSELEVIRQTPSLLMINQDFDTFDPTRHPWIQLQLLQRPEGGLLRTNQPLAVHEYGELFNHLAEAVLDSDEDVFAAAHDLVNEVRLSDASRVFEARPGVFGISIDLIRGVDVVAQLFRRLGGPRERDN